MENTLPSHIEPKRPLAVWAVSLFLLWITASSASGLYFAQIGQAGEIPPPFQLNTNRGIFELILASANLFAAIATSLLMFAGRVTALRAISVWFWINLLTVGWFLGLETPRAGHFFSWARRQSSLSRCSSTRVGWNAQVGCALSSIGRSYFPTVSSGPTNLVYTLYRRVHFSKGSPYLASSCSSIYLAPVTETGAFQWRDFLHWQFCFFR